MGEKYDPSKIEVFITNDDGEAIVIDNFVNEEDIYEGGRIFTRPSKI